MPRERPLIVLDDDPTGAQAEAGVLVALDWDPSLLGALAERAPRALHVLTNTRALAETDAGTVTREAAAAAAAAFPGSRILLRGDSTLRAHLLAEYLAVRDVVHRGRNPVLMLVPALPAAGRVTEGGVHYLERDGRRTPISNTEYARDPDFAYSSSRLLEWAQERSGGHFPVSDGAEVSLDELRRPGGTAVSDALLGLSATGRAAALAVDSTCGADLELVASGLRAAEQSGAEVIVRSGPAFVGVLSGTSADGYQPMPEAPTAALVLCGSHVPASTRQLERVQRRWPESIVWLAPERLLGERAQAEIAEFAALAAARLRRDGLAVVATAREVHDYGDRLRAGGAIASGVAAILARLRGEVDVVVSKGGITSAVNIREGLQSSVATVLGPLRDGISLWSVDTPERIALPFVVFPGNVGGDDELAALVEAIAGRRDEAARTPEAIA